MVRNSSLDINTFGTPNMYEDIFLNTDLDFSLQFESGGARSPLGEQVDTIHVLPTPQSQIGSKSPKVQNSIDPHQICKDDHMVYFP